MSWQDAQRPVISSVLTNELPPAIAADLDASPFSDADVSTIRMQNLLQYVSSGSPSPSSSQPSSSSTAQRLPAALISIQGATQHYSTFCWNWQIPRAVFPLSAGAAPGYELPLLRVNPARTMVLSLGALASNTSDPFVFTEPLQVGTDTATDATPAWVFTSAYQTTSTSVNADGVFAPLVSRCAALASIPQLPTVGLRYSLTNITFSLTGWPSNFSSATGNTAAGYHNLTFAVTRVDSAGIQIPRNILLPGYFYRIIATALANVSYVWSTSALSSATRSADVPPRVLLTMVQEGLWSTEDLSAIVGAAPIAVAPGRPLFIYVDAPPVVGSTSVTPSTANALATAVTVTASTIMSDDSYPYLSVRNASNWFPVRDMLIGGAMSLSPSALGILIMRDNATLGASITGASPMSDELGRCAAATAALSTTSTSNAVTWWNRGGWINAAAIEAAVRQDELQPDSIFALSTLCAAIPMYLTTALQTFANTSYVAPGAEFQFSLLDSGGAQGFAQNQTLGLIVRSTHTSMDLLEGVALQSFQTSTNFTSVFPAPTTVDPVTSIGAVRIAVFARDPLTSVIGVYSLTVTVRDPVAAAIKSAANASAAADAVLQGATDLAALSTSGGNAGGGSGSSANVSAGVVLLQVSSLTAAYVTVNTLFNVSGARISDSNIMPVSIAAPVTAAQSTQDQTRSLLLNATLYAVQATSAASSAVSLTTGSTGQTFANIIVTLTSTPISLTDAAITTAMSVTNGMLLSSTTASQLSVGATSNQTFDSILQTMVNCLSASYAQGATKSNISTFVTRSGAVLFDGAPAPSSAVSTGIAQQLLLYAAAIVRNEATDSSSFFSSSRVSNTSLSASSLCQPGLAIGVVRFGGFNTSTTVNVTGPAAALSTCGRDRGITSNATSPASYIQPSITLPRSVLDSALLSRTGSIITANAVVVQWAIPPVDQQRGWNTTNTSDISIGLPGKNGSSNVMRLLTQASQTALDTVVISVTLSTAQGQELPINNSVDEILIQLPQANASASLTSRVSTVVRQVLFTCPPAVTQESEVLVATLNSTLPAITVINGVNESVAGATSAAVRIVGIRGELITVSVLSESTSDQLPFRSLFESALVGSAVGAVTDNHRQARLDLHTDATSRALLSASIPATALCALAPFNSSQRCMPAYTVQIDCGTEAGLITTDVCRPSLANQPISFACPTVRRTAACGFWNETAQKWETSGCRLFSVHADSVVCACTHLTDFAARFVALAEEQQNVFSAAQQYQSTDVLYKYPYVFITLGCCAVAYIVGAIAAWLMDGVSAKRFYVALRSDPEIRMMHDSAVCFRNGQTAPNVFRKTGNFEDDVFDPVTHQWVLDRVLDSKTLTVMDGGRFAVGVRRCCCFCIRKPVTTARTGLSSNTKKESNRGHALNSDMDADIDDIDIIESDASLLQDPYASALLLPVLRRIDECGVLPRELDGIHTFDRVRHVTSAETVSNIPTVARKAAVLPTPSAAGGTARANTFTFDVATSTQKLQQQQSSSAPMNLLTPKASEVRSTVSGQFGSATGDKDGTTTGLRRSITAEHSTPEFKKQYLAAQSEIFRARRSRSCCVWCWRLRHVMARLCLIRLWLTHTYLVRIGQSMYIHDLRMLCCLLACFFFFLSFRARCAHCMELSSAERVYPLRPCRTSPASIQFGDDVGSQQSVLVCVLLRHAQRNPRHKPATSGTSRGGCIGIADRGS
jgi:hypothetical protein